MLVWKMCANQRLTF